MRAPSVPFFVVGLLGLVVSCSDDPATTGSSSGASSSGSSVTSASFKNDVVPILSKNCALAACHSSKESDLGIHMTYDAEQLYTELQKASRTPGYGGAKYVVAGKPEQSILIAKLEGTQNETFSTCKDKCGTEMPPGDSLGEEDIEIVRYWIKNGAKND